jgi:hypothetical protein
LHQEQVAVVTHMAESTVLKQVDGEELAVVAAFRPTRHCGVRKDLSRASQAKLGQGLLQQAAGQRSVRIPFHPQAEQEDCFGWQWAERQIA